MISCMQSLIEKVKTAWAKLDDVYKSVMTSFIPIDGDKKLRFFNSVAWSKSSLPRRTKLTSTHLCTCSRKKDRDHEPKGSTIRGHVFLVWSRVKSLPGVFALFEEHDNSICAEVE